MGSPTSPIHLPHSIPRASPRHHHHHHHHHRQRRRRRRMRLPFGRSRHPPLLSAFLPRACEWAGKQASSFATPFLASSRRVEGHEGGKWASNGCDDNSLSERTKTAPRKRLRLLGGVGAAGLVAGLSLRKIGSVWSGLAWSGGLDGGSSVHCNHLDLPCARELVHPSSLGLEA
ncbi:hypothetical protein IWZ00DRAFT_182264 [Phyllosticta capitalensis]